MQAVIDVSVKIVTRNNKLWASLSSLWLGQVHTLIIRQRKIGNESSGNDYS